jgi:hypothetical protein
MELTPFGVLNNGHKDRKTGLFAPMYEWPGTRDEFRQLLQGWIGQVEDAIWPAWNAEAEHGPAWAGKAAACMVDATRAELKLAVLLYHGAGGAGNILDQSPLTPEAEDRRVRTHRWHYEVEDLRKFDLKYSYLTGDEAAKPSFDFRASQRSGSNFLVYDPTIDIKRFEDLFWGRMRGLQPPIFDIKEHFQRPRPWTAAAGLGVRGFRWITADGATHTGVHPAMLSGHCIQGVLGGCCVFDALLTESRKTGEGLSTERINGMQRHMVDWGDRRVFAGVHYMTDNIASWTLARLLIPHLFGTNAQEVENFAVQAITRHSRVFADVVKYFANGKLDLSDASADMAKLAPTLDVLAPARAMLRTHFPEVDMAA